MSAGELSQPDDDAVESQAPAGAAPDESPAAPLDEAAPLDAGAPPAVQNSPDAELEALLEDWSFDELAPIPSRFLIQATFSSRWKTNAGDGKLLRDEDGLPCLPLEVWLPVLHDASLLAAEALDANRADGPRWRSWHDYLFGGAGSSGALAVGRLRVPSRLRDRLRVKAGQSDEHAMPRLRSLLTSTVESANGPAEAGAAGTILTAEAQWAPPADRLRALACTSLLAAAMQLIEQLGDDARFGFGRATLSIAGFKNSHLALRWLDSHRTPPARNGDAAPVAAPGESIETPASETTSHDEHEDELHEGDAPAEGTEVPADEASSEAAPSHRRRSRHDHGRDRIHQEDDAFPLASLLERELWRKELRTAAKAWAGDSAKTAAFWGSAFPGAIDSRSGGSTRRTPPASHWSHLAELGRRTQSEADAKTGSSWCEKAKNSVRWKRVWPTDALDRLAKVFNDPKHIWEILFDAAGRRGGWPTLTAGADKRLTHDLWGDAVQAFLTSSADAARQALGEPTAAVAEATR